MEEKIKERVAVLMKELSISPYTLAKNSNIGERTMYNQLTGQSKIGIAAIVAILNKYTNVSAEWLMRGDGEMLKGSKFNHKSIIPASNDERTMNERLDNEDIAQLKDTISRQQREIDGLYERIDELKRATSIAAPRSVTAV